MNTPVIQCLALLVLLASSSKIFGNQVGLVVPQELAEVEGVVPSAVPPSFPDGDRIQFVLPASAFDSLPASHRTLTGLRLRPDSERTTTIEQQDDFLIRLSTTDRGLDQLSLDFDENFGLDETTVFDGLISLSSDLGGPPEGPRRFDLEVSFQTPFNFDPTDGNLLIDIVERGPRVGIARSSRSVRTERPLRSQRLGNRRRRPTSRSCSGVSVCSRTRSNRTRGDWPLRCGTVQEVSDLQTRAFRTDGGCIVLRGVRWPANSPRWPTPPSAVVLPGSREFDDATGAAMTLLVTKDRLSCAANAKSLRAY